MFCPLCTMMRTLAEKHAPGWSYLLHHGRRNSQKASRDCLVFSGVIAPTDLSGCTSWKRPPGSRVEDRRGEGGCQPVPSGKTAARVPIPAHSTQSHVVVFLTQSLVNNTLLFHISGPVLCFLFHSGITPQGPGHSRAAAPRPTGVWRTGDACSGAQEQGVQRVGCCLRSMRGMAAILAGGPCVWRSVFWG